MNLCMTLKDNYDPFVTDILRLLLLLLLFCFFGFHFLKRHGERPGTSLSDIWHRKQLYLYCTGNEKSHVLELSLADSRGFGHGCLKYLKVSGRRIHSAWSQGMDPGLDGGNNHKICFNIS